MHSKNAYKKTSLLRNSQKRSLHFCFLISILVFYFVQRISAAEKKSKQTHNNSTAFSGVHQI